MPRFDECCVLIPASTLEDFPSNLSDYDARSLLASWSVLWHPRLLAETEQLPVWYRADAPPEPIGKRLFAVPHPSLSQLPDNYAARAEGSEESTWLTGDSRQDMLESLALEPCQPLTYPGETSSQTEASDGDKTDPNAPASGARTIDERDFFAAAYASLQVQVMTRRLRYTSNLDEIHLQNRVVAAAKAFLAGEATEAIEALHDVFDCLAEERDHYFSSDPHLVDLTLTSTSTLETLLSDFASTPPTDADDDPSILPTPSNVLVDGDVAEKIGASDSDDAKRFRTQLQQGQIGWAGGGPAASVCLDSLTLAEAEAVFEQAHQSIKDALGTSPPVYGRFAGSTPSDLTGTLVRLGYRGMIPVDFAAGSGFGDEAKVIMQSSGGDIEALTAKPIDAASDAAFLGLGARLGEAIDSGEIATALLAHWPGQSCEAFEDLKRVASWSLSLGKFWKLDDYFIDGEHPYHHGTLSAASPTASQLLTEAVEAKRPDPISSLADAFRENVDREQQKTLLGMTELVTGQPVREDELPDQFVSAIGLDVADEANPAAMLIVNAHSTGVRESVTLEGGSPAAAKHLYAATSEGTKTTSTVDIPACGFVVVQSGPSGSATNASFGKRLKGKLFGGPKPIAESGRMQNEFMEVAISTTSGGISGVYSGGSRGNRFSMRLVKCKPLPAGTPRETLPGDETEMRCRKQTVVTATPALGCIEVSGDLIEGESETELGTFTLRYTLARGSRTIRVDGEISPKREVTGKPWEHYFAARAAVATESAICRSLLRDKLHRAKSRRLVAPLGVVLDEAERQTYVGGNGSAFHRRVGDRFLDTLISVEGESKNSFTLHYGMDLATPVNAARELLAAPIQIPVVPNSGASEIGWLVHTKPKDILVSRLEVGRRSDGRLAALVRLVQTRPQSCKPTIRFLRDVDSAFALFGSGQSIDVEVPAPKPKQNDGDVGETDESTSRSDAITSSGISSSDPQPLKCEGDAVSLSLASHGAVDLLVLFADES